MLNLKITKAYPVTDRIPIPFASAHRAGNNKQAALQAVEAGADLIETDIWLHKGRLELRHKQTLGPIPILWEKWSIEPGWKPRYYLRDLLHDVPDDVLIFLDFKGEEMGLGPAVLEELNRTAPGRTIATCGRNYPQLQTIDGAPNIITFYSVGDESEWPIAQELIRNSATPALSIRADLATPERIAWMNNLGGPVVCWGVDDPDQAQQLRALGVDGFTTDNDDLIKLLRERRDAETRGAD